MIRITDITGHNDWFYLLWHTGGRLWALSHEEGIAVFETTLRERDYLDLDKRAAHEQQYVNVNGVTRCWLEVTDCIEAWDFIATEIRDGSAQRQLPDDRSRGGIPLDSP